MNYELAFIRLNAKRDDLRRRRIALKRQLAANEAEDDDVMKEIRDLIAQARKEGSLI